MQAVTINVSDNLEELDLSMDEHTWIVLMLMHEDGREMTCSNITNPRYWSVNWDKCPLCNAVPKDGVIIHGEQH